MSYTIESVNGCTKKFIFNLETVDLSSQVENRLKRKQKTVNLKGFRPGKAPIEMVRKLYAGQVENEALYDFVANEFFTAIEKEGIRAIGQPQFGQAQYEPEKKKVNFSATVEVQPDVQVSDYTNLTFTKNSDEVSEEEVEKALKTSAEELAQMVPLADTNIPLRNGHFAVFNFKGKRADGSEPQDMMANDYMLEIGSNSFIPGFEEGMMGLKAGEKKTLTLTFPQDYSREDLRGEKVEFAIELLEIKTKEYPAMDDEFAKNQGHESFAQMRQKIRSQLENYKVRKNTTELHEQILKKLLESNSFDVPETMIKGQMGSLVEELSHNLKSKGFNESMLKTYFSKYAEDLRQKAIFQIRAGLVLDRIARDHKIESSEKDFPAKFEEMAQESGLGAKEVESYYSKNENLKKALLYSIREEKTFEVIKKKVKIVEA